MSSESLDEAPIWYAMSAPYREMKVADSSQGTKKISRCSFLWNAASVWWGSTYASESFPIAP